MHGLSDIHKYLLTHYSIMDSAAIRIEEVANNVGFKLKMEQKEVILSVVSKRHTFAQLPCGYGKSLTFQLLPKVLGKESCVLVACPLVSLIESHKIAIEKLNMSCIVMGKEGYKMKTHHDFIIATPEALMEQENREWIRKQNICCFVADEVHTVPKW